MSLLHVGKPLVLERCVLFLAMLFSATAAHAAPPAAPDAQQILSLLNRTIAWSARINGQADLTDQPAEILFVNDNRQLARQIVALSFDAAKAAAPLVPQATAVEPSRMSSRLSKRLSSTADVLKREQARLGDLQSQLVSARPIDRPRLEAAVAEAQSRVAIATVRNEAASGIAGFAGDTASGSSDLMSQISALEQTVSASNAVPVPAPARRVPAASVVALISDLIHLDQKDATLKRAIAEADALQRDARATTAPLSAMMTQARQRTDVLMNLPDTNDPAELLRRKSELDALSARFRTLSAAMVPMAKRRILLDAYKSSVGRWRSSVIEQYREELRRLIYRAVVLGILLLLVLAIALAWRRITYRYVADVKRRHHFLLIRRIVILVLVAGILTATFASDFSSLTTFVGLLTAGIAIALQDVILSLAGYFVIIGKYGIRVGDRVRIASVNGDVLDVGLVWIYLMELETRGSDQLPTGRIVEFPNSVVFDHSAGIFKQLPGTRFLWHEVSRIVPSTSDFRSTQMQMLGAVESVFDEYHDAIDRQHRDMDRLLGTSTAQPRPHSRLRVAPNGVEIRVRYPVEIEQAGDIDDRIAAAITEASSAPQG